MASRRVARILFAAVGIVLSAVAFLRGNYLFGFACGVLYAGTTIGLLWILARSLAPTGSLSLVRVAVMTALSLAVGFVMAWPASVSSDVQDLIDKQAIDRAARAELAVVLASDPAYRDLSVSTFHLTPVNVTVRGALATRSDLDRLRARIIAECPALTRGGCVLHWDVTLRDPPQRINGVDSELFGAGARAPLFPPRAAGSIDRREAPGARADNEPLVGRKQPCGSAESPHFWSRRVI
jgi:hypothetical protein